MIVSAPPAVVPAVYVVLLALGTALGFWLVRQALAVRAAQLVPGSGAPAADVARAALDAISPRAQPAAAYMQLGHALRNYLDTQFDIDSTTLSGAEAERAMTRAGVTRPAARMTAQLLERCDRMQSAAADPPSPERIAADIANAREIIDLTSTGA